MTQPTGSERKLPYPLKDTLDLESVVGSGGVDFLSLDGWTADPEERQNIILNISLDEYVALASTIDVGRDIAYGDNSIYIWWLWVRSLFAMDICQAVSDCIDSTPAIQQQIATYSNSSAITQTTPEQQEILDTDLFGGQDPCDNDEIFGMTLQMTDLLNQISEDVLEQFVTAFAIPGRIGDIIEAIPGLGILPYDDLLQMFEKLAEQVNDSYVAAYDVQIREDIACDLFCIGQQNCTLTLEQARDYFQDKIITAVSNSNFLSIVEDIIANNWLGEQSIYMMHWFILDTIIFGGEILGIDTNRVVTTIASYFNDPDSDWSTLCDPCSTWEETWDFTVESGASDGWQVVTWGDGWQSGLGWRSEKSSYRQNNYLQNFMPVSGDVTYLAVTFSNGGSPLTFATGGGGDNIVAATWLPAYTEQVRYDADGTLINITLVIYDDVALNMERWGLLCNPGTPNDWYVTSATVRGTGTNPYD